MMKTNKLTKTLAFPIATGAAALGVLAGSVLTATSASAVNVLTWTDFITAGNFLQNGDKTVTYVSDTFAAGAIPDLSFVTLNMLGEEYTVTLMTTGMITVPGAWTYEIETLIPFTGVQVDSDVTPGYGDVVTDFAPAGITLTSTNGWPDPTALGSFAPVPGALTLLTVTNTLNPVLAGAGLMSSSNKFTQATIQVPEPGTILGLLTVGGLGLVSRFKKQK
ncbi:PEP-CTERM sorting domain-containing protein [Microcystis wesenbergii FACHB-1317]|uniref:PEP-CTERM sorting domain-containing protein n=1 Tax=Microcystis TaxID=1125 RepID=UPI00168003C9|nr:MULTISPECIES: PEP-CTERM sorting domain-containing protein [Microcystis]MBD2288709.1 PEP-CTERM sorting domain-containing protein [Microcystis wesenbergii FACHB-1317]UZO75665.1 PEP-CTERM sorting domain-containing protein [Microcystis aeruginosa str. Chao 1910]